MKNDCKRSILFFSSSSFCSTVMVIAGFFALTLIESTSFISFVHRRFMGLSIECLYLVGERNTLPREIKLNSHPHRYFLLDTRPIPFVIQYHPSWWMALWLSIIGRHFPISPNILQRIYKFLGDHNRDQGKGLLATCSSIRQSMD